MDFLRGAGWIFADGRWWWGAGCPGVAGVAGVALKVPRLCLEIALGLTSVTEVWVEVAAGGAIRGGYIYINIFYSAPRPPRCRLTGSSVTLLQGQGKVGAKSGQGQGK